MHPEVRQDGPGRCPKCGMNLVPEKNPKPAQKFEDKGLGKLTWRSYIPLLVIIGLIAVVTLVLTYRDAQLGAVSAERTIMYFMAGFFIVFAGFKLMDLSGFAHGYMTYDLLAQRWMGYGFIYPFIELFFGLAMILNWGGRPLLWVELVVMAFSGLGVAIKLARREQFQCACLGTFLKVPLTKITLIEDFGMAALAGTLLFLR